MGDEWDDVPSVSQPSAFGPTAVVRMYCSAAFVHYRHIDR